MTGLRTLLAALVAVTGGLGATAAQPAAGAASADASARAASAPTTVQITRFLGEQRLPHMMRLDGTVVGGISGFDRDPASGTWYFISDDRWRYDPARFYTGTLQFDPRTGRFTAVRLTRAVTLRHPDRGPYPGYGKPGSADPESIRFDPRSGRLLWASEGDRPTPAKPDIPISGQFLRWSDRDGGYRGDLHLPAGLRLTGTDRGPRRNQGIEGLALARHTIAAAIEGPRHEDGPPPTVRHGAPVRITTWTRHGTIRGQYAYPLDRLPAAPDPPDGDFETGISEILAVDDHRYLALERSWIQGVGYKVKLYEFDLRGATNVLGRGSLTTGRYHPVRKRLVLDLSTVRSPVQNLEGLAWGPRLATGECTLIIGSDDNFDAFGTGEVNQFLAFATRTC